MHLNDDITEYERNEQIEVFSFKAILKYISFPLLSYPHMLRSKKNKNRFLEDFYILISVGIF